MAEEKDVPFIVEDWIDHAGGGLLHLKGQRCNRCGVCAFPPTAHCKACGSADSSAIHLGPEAELHSWTVDRMGTFLGRPHLVGQVHFPEGTFVQGFIDGDIDNPPAIGRAIELVPFLVESGGDQLITYGFKVKEG